MVFGATTWSNEVSTNGQLSEDSCVRSSEGPFVAPFFLGWVSFHTTRTLEGKSTNQKSIAFSLILLFAHDNNNDKTFFCVRFSTNITHTLRAIHHQHGGNRRMLQRCLRVLCLLLASVALSKAFSASSLKQRELVSIVWRADTAEEETVAAPATTREAEDATTELKMSPVIQQIVDERRQYQVNLGKAMDVLRQDMQDILTKKPGTCESKLCEEIRSCKQQFHSHALFLIFFLVFRLQYLY